MDKVMISLVGGRPVPNIQAALHIRPSIQYFVVSKDSMGKGRDLEKTIAALPDGLKPPEENIKPVSPYSLQETIDACREIVAKHSCNELIFNVTSGPKTMAFAAYDVAKELKKDGGSVDVCYLSNEGLVWVFQNNNEKVSIELKEYFASYGWQVTFKPDQPSEKFQQLVSLFIREVQVSTRLLSKLRRSDRGKGKRSIKTEYLPDDEYSLLKEIEGLGVVSNVDRDLNNTSYTICSDEDGIILLGGDWLEYYVYQTANSIQVKAFKCGWGVKEDAAAKGELDFVGIYGGQLIVASCKTETSLERKWLEELHSYTEQLGKGMCSGIFICTVSGSSRDQKTLESYQKWASERRIVLVLAEDLPNLPAILKKVVLSDPNADPKDIPYYPRI